ncbi:hypothetical protein MAR_035287 [Mya arenaria]|uniref:Uncharacterized protein n=1 Tax=Mya arenaria TaxID=6604 RepID=A0ABY7ESP7_MYAAR|nr:hypothetical protein MAR_035287 [Mya arenaria]
MSSERIDQYEHMSSTKSLIRRRLSFDMMAMYVEDIGDEDVFVMLIQKTSSYTCSWMNVCFLQLKQLQVDNKILVTENTDIYGDLKTNTPGSYKLSTCFIEAKPSSKKVVTVGL